MSNTPARKYKKTFPLYPLLRSASEDAIDDAPTAEHIWARLFAYSEVRAKGRQLFSGSLGQRNKLFDEFSNYVRQARAYFDAARPLNDASVSLLYYYAFLQLAKAELLISNPSAVYRTTIHHGLSYRPGSASRPLTSKVSMLDNGVFPLLYAKRTQRAVAKRIDLPVSKLTPLATDSYGSTEDPSGWSDPKLTDVRHTLGVDDTHCWSMIALTHFELIGDNRYSSAIWNAELEEVASPRLPDLIFRIDRIHLKWRFFQSRSPLLLAQQGAARWSELRRQAFNTALALQHVIEEPYDLGSEGTAYPAVYKTKDVIIPPSLINYILMYFCSSLVRYEPAKLDTRLHGMQAWALHYFTTNSALALLQDAFRGITGTTIRFTGYRGKRL